MRWLAMVLAALVLAACAPLPVGVKGNAAMLQAQAQREQLLAGRNHWTLRGHLGVSDGSHGGSGTLVWEQDGSRFRFTLRAPITGRSFELTAGPDGAVLQGLDGGPVRGRNAQALMARVLGWHVPVKPLVDWVRGLRAGADSATQPVLMFAPDGLPVSLQQDGWTIHYRSWFTRLHPALPERVFASHGNFQVRLAIQSWSFASDR